MIKRTHRKNEKKNKTLTNTFVITRLTRPRVGLRIDLLIEVLPRARLPRPYQAFAHVGSGHGGA